MRTSCLYLLTVAILLAGCNSSSLALSEPGAGGPTGQTVPSLTTETTKSALTATVVATEIPAHIKERTPEPSPPAMNAKPVQYSAEKLSLAPLNLSLDLPGILAQDSDSNSLKIGIKNWSNKGQKLT